MTYCTYDDLITRLAVEKVDELADDDGDGEPDDEVISEVCAAASREVDRWLGSVVSVPLTDANLIALVKDKAVDIANYELFSRKGIEPQTADETVQRKYDKAIEWLKLVAKGVIKLTSELGTPRTSSVTITKGRMFTDEMFEKLP